MISNSNLVILGTALLGVSCGALGCFIVLRGRTLIGDTLAHATLPGVVASYLIVGERDFSAMIIGALISSTLAAFFMTIVKSATPIKADTYLSVTLGGWFACGIFLLDIVQRQSGGNQAGLQSFIFGQAAGMLQSDLEMIVLVSLAVLSCVVCFWRQLKLLCFDQNFLRSVGLSAALLDALLMLMTAFLIIAGLPAVGALLITAILFIPAVSAKLLVNSLSQMVLLSATFGMIAAVSGAYVSSKVSIPTGPAIILAAGILCLAAVMVSKFQESFSIKRAR